MIYCVEDDDNIRELVIYTLEQRGLKPEGLRMVRPFTELWRLKRRSLFFWISCFREKTVWRY